MNKNVLRYGLAVLPALAIGAGAAAWLDLAPPAKAADHTDPPGRAAANAADDLGDLYAWHSGTGADLKINVIVTFAGPVEPAANQGGVWDRDVLYGVHLDTDKDQTADADIYMRFGQNNAGDWGIQVTGMPGEAEPVVGAVGGTIDAPAGGKVWAGLADDPFFFDLQGFQESLVPTDMNDPTTATLSFMNDRDFFAGKNITAIVVQIPASDALGAETAVDVWATTARINN